LKTAQSR
jgi:hypothetical protein